MHVVQHCTPREAAFALSSAALNSRPKGADGRAPLKVDASSVACRELLEENGPSHSSVIAFLGRLNQAVLRSHNMYFLLRLINN